MSKRYENRYGRGDNRRDRDRADDRGHDREHDRGHDRQDDRGYISRAGDEFRSWFGDDDAERRRHMDEQRDRQRERHEGWQRESPGRSDWNRPEGWRGSSQDQSRYRDPASNYSSSEANRGGDWDPYRYRQSAPDDDRDRIYDRDRTSDRDRPYERERTADRDRDYDRGGSREQQWDRDRPMNRLGGSAWSADEGRSGFGDPPTGDFGYGQRGMRQHLGQREENRWGRGPKGYQRADNRIHEDVCDRLTYSDVDAENIEVSVTNGEVTLTGSVRDRSDKRRAEDVVEEVSGVRDVHNNIRVHREDRGDRGIGMSEHTNTGQPGSVLGVNPAAAAATPTTDTNTTNTTNTTNKK